MDLGHIPGAEVSTGGSGLSKNKPTGTWVVLVSAQVTLSQLCGFEPHIRLCTGSMEPAWDSLSPSLSARPPLALSLSHNK